MTEDSKRPIMHGEASPRIFQRAESLRRKMTEPEKKLWNFLKEKPLGFKFRKQHPFDLYVLDFYCHRAKLSIEIDGKSHSRKLQMLQDQFKRESLNQLQIREIRFTNEDVLNNFEIVCEKIIELLRTC